jgi:CubicO group peptidase (beta-lactamase class C family)
LKPPGGRQYSPRVSKTLPRARNVACVNAIAIAGLLTAAGCLTPLRFEPGVPAANFFPRDPEGGGLDAVVLAKLIREAEQSRSDAVIVMRDGKVLVERYFGGPSGPILTMSVTKSIVSLAIGLLIAEGKIASVDAPLSTWFPEFKEGKKALITLKHILTQTSGIAHLPAAGKLYRQPDRVKYVRESPVVDEPGTKFSYSNEGTELLSGVIAMAAGKQVDAYLQERVFLPLGITEWKWDKDKTGNVSTYADLALSARDLAKVGQLLLDGGRWEGKEILPGDWVRRVGAPASPEVPWYGYLWWVVSEGNRLFQVPGALPHYERKGFPAARKLAPLNGRAFRDRGDYVRAARAVLDDAEMAELTRRGLPYRVKFGTPIGYRADGWLGQSLVILPAHRLVAVRMHRPAEGGDDAENRRYGFWAFLPRLLQAVLRRK